MKTRTLITCIALALFCAAAAGAAGGTPPMPPDSSFSAHVTNPWFPLEPGTRWVYTGVKDGKRSRDVVIATHATKTIAGVPCVAVGDLLYLRGRLEERTTDWYSQDSKGNVWYFGENTAELDRHGQVTSTEGTWQTGVHGAKAGIFMPADLGRRRAGRVPQARRGSLQDVIFDSKMLLTRESTPLDRACSIQVLRAGHRQRARANREGWERAKRARLRHERRLTSPAARMPLRRAPSISACQAPAVCSPAKTIGPTGRAKASSSSGDESVRAE